MLSDGTRGAPEAFRNTRSLGGSHGLGFRVEVLG